MVFEEQITDFELLKAYFRACRRPKIAASQVKEELGKSMSVRRVKERMQDISKKGKLTDFLTENEITELINESFTIEEIQEMVKEGSIKAEMQGSTWVFQIEEFNE